MGGGHHDHSFTTCPMQRIALTANPFRYSFIVTARDSHSSQRIIHKVISAFPANVLRVNLVSHSRSPGKAEGVFSTSSEDCWLSATARVALA